MVNFLIFKKIVRQSYCLRALYLPSLLAQRSNVNIICAETWLQVGYNGGEPITYEFFMSEMRGKLDTIIAQELMPWMDDAQHQQFLEEEAYRFQRYPFPQFSNPQSNSTQISGAPNYNIEITNRN